MFRFIRDKGKYLKNKLTEPESKTPTPSNFSKDLLENTVSIREKFSNSSDLIIKPITVSGFSVALVMCEGMVDLQTMSELLVEPIQKLTLPGYSTPDDLLHWVRYDTALAADQQEISTFEELFQFIMSGFVVVLIDGTDKGTALGLQGFNFRGISESSAEQNIRGSREGFVEPIRINLTMVRRRIKSPKLKFELMNIGTQSKTDICMVYMTDTVSPKILDHVRSSLKRIQLKYVLESGYLEPFLDEHPLSVFSGIGNTERPDTLCAKILEGRVGILVDGTPFALIIPYLFAENFQSVDDYSHRPYYSTFIRILKYISFAISILLPGLYVGIATFHPELFPEALLFNIATAQESTPFPLMAEAIIIHLIYEAMREAGLRLPRGIGHAVSIVGALVIGDAAVTAGLIGSPMVMVVALTAVSSFVVPSLYEPVTVLRFLYIIVGGVSGLYGISLLTAVLCINLCSIHPMDIPYTSPISPFGRSALRDVFVRAGWKTLSRHNIKVQNMPGSEIKGER